MLHESTAGWGAAMPGKMLAMLALGMALGGCGVSPETGRRPGTHSFDWPREGIRASIEYRTVPALASGTTCAGNLYIENYGNKRYTVLLFNVNVFSASRELIATDRFSFSSNLGPGDKGAIAADPHNPLNPVVITRRYSECPKEMALLDVKLEAF